MTKIIIITGLSFLCLYALFKLFKRSEPSWKYVGTWAGILTLTSGVLLIVTGKPQVIGLIAAAIWPVIKQALPWMMSIASRRVFSKQDPNTVQPPSAHQDMSLEEACDILNVSKDATESEIHSQYKKMMQKNHPDRGGSEYLAQKINQAKALLLKLKKKP